MKQPKDWKRLWIPAVGWTLCYGLFFNCVIQPFTDAAPVSWEHVLTGLGIMLGISGFRDIGLNKGKHHDQNNRPM